MSGARTTLGILALVLALPLAHAEEGEPIVERVEGAAPGEVDAFTRTRDRFEARVSELQADALRRLEGQRARQEARIRGFYDERIDALAAETDAQRDAAVDAFEAFLARHDEVAVASDVRLRLAELYFQDAEAAWLADTRRYFEALDAAGDDLDALAEIEAEGEPRIDLSGVIELLDTIVEANEGLPLAEQYRLLDVAWYMLAFGYAEPNSAQYDREAARSIFRDLIAARPDSDYADAAHLMLGSYAFEDNDYEASIPEFEAVLRGGPERRSYGQALYQLAWARYKLDQYEQAMSGFVELLDLSEEREDRTGRPSEFAPDAVAYLALSLSDLADQHGVSPLAEAQAYFGRIGRGRPWRWDVLRELAASLVRYARPLDAVEVYEHLQTDAAFVDRAENPGFQDEVVRLLSSGYDADLAAAGEARLVMTDRYGEGSTWWVANRDNPEAQERARRFIESYLLDVAIEVKVRAQESGDPEAYALAAQKYREYLDRFPISDDYFANQFQLADSLYRSGQIREALAEYDSLVDNARYHQYADASLYMRFRAAEQVMRDLVGPPEEPASNRQVEDIVEVPGGTRQVFALEASQADFVEAADAVLAHTFGPPTEGLDLDAVVRQNRAKILYLPAQVLFYANRFEEARPRLQKIVKEHPLTDEGAYAANLYLNTWILDGDNAQVRRWSREFASMQLGADSALSAEKERQFQDTLEKASYAMGTEAYERGDYEGAAEAYLSFVDEFPGSPNVPDALLSAAFNYDRLGRAEDANALYQRFVRDFPDHPEARPFYFKIASNYEATFQLEKAVAYYERFLAKFPDDKDAPSAQFMVAFLREGLGEHLEAARGYEAYATAFPDADDREDVHFRAGRQYELVDADRAIRFYGDYLDAYGVTNADHALEAQARIADLYAAAGNQRRADRARDAIVERFDEALAAGSEVGPAGRDLAAAAAFRALQAQADDIREAELSRNETRDTKLLLETLPGRIEAFDEDASAFIDRYLSFPYTTAALYLQGAVRQSYATLGFAVEPPRGLNMDQQAAYWELLEETLFEQMRGVEQQAVRSYQRVIDLARAQKRHAEWVDRAREGLNDIDPTSWPDVKEPLAGDADALEAVRVAPIAPDLPGGEP